MKSSAPMSRRIIRTKGGNRRRVGSCTMVGEESWYLTPRVSSSHAPAAQYILNPFTFSTISERNEESLRRSKNIHWGPVDLT